MCGIFGSITETPIGAHCLRKIQDSLSHRGPDGGRHEDWELPGMGWISMVHTRLSIFDLSEAGNQPMHDSDGRVLVFNGEIYNWPELRKELESKGHVFHTLRPCTVAAHINGIAYLVRNGIERLRISNNAISSVQMPFYLGWAGECNRHSGR